MKRFLLFLWLIILPIVFSPQLQATQRENNPGTDEEAVINETKTDDGEAQIEPEQTFNIESDAPQDNAAAVEWFLKAAVQGKAVGQIYIG